MKTSIRFAIALTILTVLPRGARAVDFHVATAQDLQNALTLAAANGADDVIWLTNGYYVGNFNFNSAEARNLTLQAEPGVTNTQITIDGAGTGRSMNLSCSATANITVRGLTFLRNCGSTGNAGLRVSTGSAADVLVEDCRFISPINTSGMGLQIEPGQNVTVSNCTVSGTQTGGAVGLQISGVSVIVQNCVITTNNLGLSAGSAGFLKIEANSFIGNANNSPFFAGGGLRCSSGSTILLTKNIFIGNQSGSGGGGGASCFLASGSLALVGNTFNGNASGYDGGGAYCSVSSGSLSLSGNIFTGNSTSGEGGGVFCVGNAALTGNSFRENSAGSGGGGANCRTATLAGNSFNGNSARDGGGVYCFNSTLIGNTFTGNAATGGSGGGALCYATQSQSVSSNKFIENFAMTGGGVHITGSTLILEDNLVVKNSQTSAGSRGGGIWMDASSNLFLVNNTITGNTSVGGGGGVAFQVYGVTEVLNVVNNIIWGNTASGNGADVHLAGTGQSKRFMFNNAHDLYGVWDIAVNNLDVSPQFFDPVNGDYHIQSTSPCKDAGTNGAPSLPATDLDGEPRIAGATVDLGCYEYATTASHPADVNTNFVLTAAEFAAYAAAWKNAQPWSNAPVVIPADYVTRAGYLMTNGGAYHNDGSARPTNWKLGP